MEFAVTALTSLASGFGAAGAGAGSAASFGAAELIGGGTAAGFNAATAGGAAAGGGLFSSLFSTSTVASVLSGAATVSSMLATRQAGEDKAWSYEQMAADTEVDRAAEGVQGLERRNTIRRALLQQLGERDVQAAASGVDLSFGSPVEARKADIRDSERALTVDQETEDIRKSRLTQRAAMYREGARQARAGALAKEAGIGLTGLAGLLRRG